MPAFTFPFSSGYRYFLFASFLGISTSTVAAELHVGPNREFTRPSQAIAAARDGDKILIDPQGKYDGDVAVIRAKDLTLVGDGGQAKLNCLGKDAAGKGIWVQYGANLTVENIEFVGARCPDKNGAGIRAQAPGLTIRNCRFADCQNGILGGMGEVRVENCEFTHCGPVPNPATHSCYFSEQITKLTFIGNYSTHTLEGHLLKCRAQEAWILYNRLTDEAGLGSAVADFPNGGCVVLIGNILQKGAQGKNDRMIAYGMEGIKHPVNSLHVIHNTMIYEHRHPNSWFVRVEKTAADFAPVIQNNLCVGNIPLTNAAQSVAAGNLLFKSRTEPGFVDPAKFDFHLQPNSSAIDKAVAVGKLEGVSLVPTEQYVHPHQREPRPARGPLDVGALEYVPAK